MTVHVGQLKLVFEVGNGAEPPNNDLQFVVLHETNREPAVTHDFNVIEIREHCPGKFNPFLQ